MDDVFGLDELRVLAKCRQRPGTRLTDQEVNEIFYWRKKNSDPIEQRYWELYWWAFNFYGIDCVGDYAQ